ncbi:MAG TPA: branched-chain amino acid aminotransferase [Candidatus Eremiobacteraeota bacterium]|nr:branched-chain amino acid aminotransferase [Candidatus Eremiobacteraeota bacterium]
MRSNFILQKNKPISPTEKLGFGQYYTPYMYVRRYRNSRWEDHFITDYELLAVDPASQMLHYGQLIFEGMKAYYNKDQEKVYLFRPEENAKRYIRSAIRLCIPQLPVADFIDSIKSAVKFSGPYIPPYSKSNPTPASLYIRPFLMGTTPKLGVKPAQDYGHVVITSPSGPYFSSGLNPIKLKVEEEYIRAAPGGTGEAKCAGNYAASLLAAEIALKEGFDQVLWLDVERKYLQEVGAMNLFVVIDNVLVTPDLDGCILPGITRDAVIELGASHFKMSVEERHVSIHEVIEGIKNNKVTEIFGSGTAAVITPVGSLGYKGEHYTIGDGKIGPIAQKMYDTLLGIQYNELNIECAKDWIIEVQIDG